MHCGVCTLVLSVWVRQLKMEDGGRDPRQPSMTWAVSVRWGKWCGRVGGTRSATVIWKGEVGTPMNWALPVARRMVRVQSAAADTLTMEILKCQMRIYIIN